MSSSTELRVSISSTLMICFQQVPAFACGRDLQEEREHLVRKIFPEMIRSDYRLGRVLYRERGAILVNNMPSLKTCL